MKLTKMYEMQKVLMDRIEKLHPTQPGEHRFNKRVVALIVEVSECANEWRGFKFWKADPQPTEKLLEEYVDGFHFVLEVGIEKGVTVSSMDVFYKCGDINEQFLYVYDLVLNLVDCSHYRFSKVYLELVQAYLGLGEMLGFTGRQIEQAYFSKNQVNHERQDNGY